MMPKLAFKFIAARADFSQDIVLLESFLFPSETLYLQWTLLRIHGFEARQVVVMIVARRWIIIRSQQFLPQYDDLKTQVGWTDLTLIDSG